MTNHGDKEKHYVAGEFLPELKVTPDKYLTIRYAGASGDFNPIHIDEDFAKQVGLPGRILHGLWSMAQAARAQTEAVDNPLALQKLAVQFRGFGLPEHEVHVQSIVRQVEESKLTVDIEVCQGETTLIKNAHAELEY